MSANCSRRRVHSASACGEVRAGAHQTHHDLSAVRAPPQEDVPHQAPAGLFVVGLDAVFGKEAAQCIADIVEHAGLQFAVGQGTMR